MTIARRRLTHLALTLAVVVSGALGSLGVEGASADAAGSARSTGDFVSLINGLRSSHGLAPLTVDGTLAASAQAWTNHMASTNTLSHDPGLASAVSGWSHLGENVGSGATVSSIWSSFLASPTHLANLLNPVYTHVGVGFVQDSHGVVWTAHRFMTLASAPPPPPPTSPPPTAPPAPVVTAPPAPAIAPAPVIAAPTGPALTTTTAPAATNATPSTDVTSSGDDHGHGSTNNPSADPDRVAEVIDALRALPA